MDSSTLIDLNIISISLPERDMEAFQDILNQQGYSSNIKNAFSIQEVSLCLQHLKNVDLALIYYDSVGPILKDIINYIKLYELHCKVVVFFENFEEDSISDAMKRGADSFVLRGRLEKIVDFLDKSKNLLYSSKLSDKELIFKALLESTTDSIWAKDLNGKYILINKAGSDFLKRPAELIIGRDDTELFPIETAAKVRKSDRFILETGQTHTIEDMLTTPDGVKRYFQAVKHVYRDEHGKPQGIIGTVRDISLRKQIEESLKFSEERFRVLVESIKDYAIFMVNPDGAVSAWNVGAERLIGYHPADIIGHNFSCLYSKEDQEDSLPAIHLNIALNRGRHEANRWLVQNSQEHFLANIIISPMYGDLTDLLGFSVIVKDLTEQKKTEETIRFYTKKLEESNKDLEEFAFIASHDLQAPLRKVVLFSQMLSGHTNDSGKELAVRLEKSAGKMQTLISDLLELSRVNRKGRAFEAVDLNLMVSDALEDLELIINESKASIILERLGYVQGDSRQLKQLFMNIISNSIKFRKKEETLVIHISAFISDNGMTQIHIKDNGIGFDSKYSDKIFKPFERLGSSEAPGNGIGLAICKKIVERHDGDISARSQFNIGTTIEIMLQTAEVVPESVVSQV